MFESMKLFYVWYRITIPQEYSPEHDDPEILRSLYRFNHSPHLSVDTIPQCHLVFNSGLLTNIDERYRHKTGVVIVGTRFWGLWFLLYAVVCKVKVKDEPATFPNT